MRLSIAKTKAAIRTKAIDAVLQAAWLTADGVKIVDVDTARADEDTFDALFAALALLRAHLDGEPLTSALTAPTTEGGILGTGSIDLALRERRFS